MKSIMYFTKKISGLVSLVVSIVFRDNVREEELTFVGLINEI